MSHCEHGKSNLQSCRFCDAAEGENDLAMIGRLYRGSLCDHGKGDREPCAICDAEQPTTTDHYAATFCDDGDAPDPRTMGLAMARMYDWDSRIVEAAIVALTDANFHEAAASLEAYLAKLNAWDAA